MQNRDEDSLHGARPSRPRRLSRSQLESMGRDTIIDLYFESDEYIRHLESSVSNSISNEERQKLKRQITDLSQRENLLVLKMTLKEQQVRELQCEADTLKKRVIPQSTTRLRASLMDPTIDLLFKKMKKELDQTKKKLEETQEELSAWKFTPESNVGKRLMAQCRQLYQENEELGKRVASGKVAKLEGDLALYRSFAQEMKQNQKEQDELLLELDEEVEGMQSTIYLLEQQLRDAKETIAYISEGSEPPDSRNENVQDCRPASNEVPPAKSQTEQLEKNEPEQETRHNDKQQASKKSDEAANEADTTRNISKVDNQDDTRQLEIQQKESNTTSETQPESCLVENHANSPES